MKESYRENLASCSGLEPYAGDGNIMGVASARGKKARSSATTGNTVFYGIKRTFGRLVQTPINPRKTRGAGVTDTR